LGQEAPRLSAATISQLKEVCGESFSHDAFYIRDNQ
jgi:hypothetical protein